MADSLLVGNDSVQETSIQGLGRKVESIFQLEGKKSLVKKGRLFGRLTRRFYKISNESLMYFKNPNDEKHKGSVQLRKSVLRVSFESQLRYNIFKEGEFGIRVENITTQSLFWLICSSPEETYMICRYLKVLSGDSTLKLNDTQSLISNNLKNNLNSSIHPVIPATHGLSNSQLQQSFSSITADLPRKRMSFHTLKVKLDLPGKNTRIIEIRSDDNLKKNMVDFEKSQQFEQQHFSRAESKSDSYNQSLDSPAKRDFKRDSISQLDGYSNIDEIIVNKSSTSDGDQGSENQQSASRGKIPSSPLKMILQLAPRAEYFLDEEEQDVVQEVSFPESILGDSNPPSHRAYIKNEEGIYQVDFQKSENINKKQGISSMTNEDFKNKIFSEQTCAQSPSKPNRLTDKQQGLHLPKMFCSLRNIVIQNLDSQGFSKECQNLQYNELIIESDIQKKSINSKKIARRSQSLEVRNYQIEYFNGQIPISCEEENAGNEIEEELNKKHYKYCSSSSLHLKEFKSNKDNRSKDQYDCSRREGRQLSKKRTKELYDMSNKRGCSQDCSDRFNNKISGMLLANQKYDLENIIGMDNQSSHRKEILGQTERILAQEKRMQSVPAKRETRQKQDNNEENQDQQRNSMNKEGKNCQKHNYQGDQEELKMLKGSRNIFEVILEVSKMIWKNDFKEAKKELLQTQQANRYQYLIDAAKVEIELIKAVFSGNQDFLLMQLSQVDSVLKQLKSEQKQNLNFFEMCLSEITQAEMLLLKGVLEYISSKKM